MTVGRIKGQPANYWTMHRRAYLALGGVAGAALLGTGIVATRTTTGAGSGAAGAGAAGA